ncbi:MAG: hypothetical protein AAGU21_00085 [Solidesulfovibrio sp.]|jgi:hypothetical protein|uniref:hypothetical protein n=1 Tax=Solidesulfovibrio sp. TaxID=2910990 RepID=UPI002B212A5E|nr:hypothetical protein [Solidesulfovibrio sp.]MEA4857014.1 hypothetical protein [Solidesulfovibrio sp.]
MLPPKVTAYELYSKAGLTVCDIQIIVDKGCPCYNSADGERIYKISDVDTENNIPFEDIQYPNEYERKQDAIKDKLAYAEFLAEDFLNYLGGIFGIEKTVFCRSSLELPNQEQRSLDVPFTLAAGPAPSLGIAEAQVQIADLKRQLEEAGRREEVLAARVAELEAEKG